MSILAANKEPIALAEPANRISRRQNQSPYLHSAILDNAVALVTSAHDGQCNVMTVTFFAESSHLPALVRVSIAPTTWTYELIKASGRFGINILARFQAELALACGTASGRGESRFARHSIPYQLGAHGVPLLRHCLTSSECIVRESVELPGHTLFVGEIVSSFRQPSLAHHKALLVSDLIDYLSG